MCYNCGCGLSDDDMGKGHLHQGGGSLTDEDIAYMAKAWNMSIEDTLKNIRDLVNKKLGAK